MTETQETVGLPKWEGKLCHHCRKPRSGHVKKRDGKKHILTCKGHAGKRYTPSKTSHLHSDFRGPSRYAYPMEMVAGRWVKKNGCPVCGRFLPPFYSTAGLRQNQGPQTKVTCTNCHSRITKPPDWKFGVPLTVEFDGKEQARKMKERAAKVKEKTGR